MNRSIHRSSNLERVIIVFKSSPSIKASMSIVACVDADNARFAFSQATRMRRNAFGFDVKSIDVLRLNSFTQCDTKRLSKSSPPRCV